MLRYFLRFDTFNTIRSKGINCMTYLSPIRAFHIKGKHRPIISRDPIYNDCGQKLFKFVVATVAMTAVIKRKEGNFVFFGENMMTCFRRRYI